ncbi:YEATS-associated helix-containing protein [Arcticibacterium luteifluviistationis]|uniref:YEATS-Like-Associating Three TM domain-containing protein n=1 Tax=Arcticibacterium luteifluviistationis TaxID=1784714 RepID=A0A2Z4G9T0_9BACT|nr:YEATS-associated helix-containing protein [Arcticibacterium luteifluviistationis]AWV97904.1 hypothetical protein DJ013_06875 [Arcticibacterium luteifluviistationis]
MNTLLTILQDSTKTGVGIVSDTNWYFFFKLIAFTVIGGIAGGFINRALFHKYYLKEEAGKRNYILIGAGAAMLIPIFLAATQSEYWDGLKNDNAMNYVIYFAFCVLAGMFARRFIASMAGSLNLDVDEIKADLNAIRLQNEALMIIQDDQGLQLSPPTSRTTLQGGNQIQVLKDSFKLNKTLIEIQDSPNWEKLVLYGTPLDGSAITSAKSHDLNKELDFSNNRFTYVRIIKRPFSDIVEINGLNYDLEID